MVSEWVERMLDKVKELLVPPPVLVPIPVAPNPPRTQRPRR